MLFFHLLRLFGCLCSLLLLCSLELGSGLCCSLPGSHLLLGNVRPARHSCFTFSLASSGRPLQGLNVCPAALLIHEFIDILIITFIDECIRSFICSINHSFMYSIIHPFNHACIRPSMRSTVCVAEGQEHGFLRISLHGLHMILGAY